MHSQETKSKFIEPQNPKKPKCPKTPSLGLEGFTYLWLVGNGGMVLIVVIILPHSSIPY